MKLKNLKMKHIVALAMALFMVLPALLVGVHATYPASGTAPYLDVVPTGGAANTSGSPYTMPAQAVGTTFSVDVRVDNYADVNQGGTNNGVSGVSYFVNWNPAVLTFVSYTDVTWLPDQQDLGDVIPSTNTGQLQVGQIVNGGTGQLTADNSAGSVSCTITFTVAAPSSYTISISNTGNAYLYAPESATSTLSTGISGTIPVYGAQYTAATSISLYKSGTESTTPQSSFSFPAGTDTIGQTFSVDVYISNPNEVPIWAWNVGVTWNAAALQLTSITEGTYLSQANLNNGNGATTLFAAGWVNNNAGDIPQGISDVYLSYTTQTAYTGVLCTLTFTVINFASSTISLTQGIPTLDTLTTTGTAPNLVYTPTAVSPAPVLNSFQYNTVAAPLPTQPQAVIVNGNPQTSYMEGQQTTLSGATSTAGVDDVPNAANTNYPNYPILTYSWSISPSVPSGDFTPTGTNGDQVLFSAPDVSVNTNYVISLTVTTASNPNDASYNPTSTTSVTLLIQPPILYPSSGPAVDTYIYQNAGTTTAPTKNGLGYGENTYCDSFAPQEIMNLGAYVTYNGAPVADKQVTWIVDDSQSDLIATIYGTTNANGIATASYQLPWYMSSGTGDSNNVGDFGIWTVTAESLIGQTYVSDVMPFMYNWTVNIASLTLGSSSLARGTGVQSVTLTLDNVAHDTENVWVTYTIMDNQNVPIVSNYVTSTVPSATYVQTYDNPALTIHDGVQTVSIPSIPIPQYAFVGTATVYINVYNQNPAINSENAVSLCPQQTATFTITAGTTSPPPGYP